MGSISPEWLSKRRTESYIYVVRHCVARSRGMRRRDARCPSLLPPALVRGVPCS